MWLALGGTQSAGLMNVYWRVDNAAEVTGSIPGAAAAVDDYCRGKEVLGCDTVGGIKTAAVLGRAEDVPAGLTVSPLDLQKLFIRMTEKREGK